MEGAFLVYALEGVRTEEVTLTLNQSSRQALSAQAVVVGQGRGEYRHRQAHLGCGDNHAAPRRDEFGELALEVWVEDESRQLRVGVISLPDAIQELRADDATATPDGGEIARVNVPTELLGTGLDLIEALGVGDELGSIESAAYVLNELVWVDSAEVDDARG